jgi:hypothetical protein
MGTITGRNVKIEVALTFDSALTVSAVTKASPPVATSTSHGSLDGEVGFFTVTAGMVELQEQAFMADNVATNTWEMPGLDSTDYSTFTAGTATMAATWGTVSEAAGYTVGGGAPAQLDDTRLTDTKTTNIAGNLASEDLNIDVRNAEVDGAAMAFIAGKAQRGLPILIKISKASQVLRVFYGIPGRPGESVSAGGAATGQFGLVGRGWVVKPNA